VLKWLDHGIIYPISDSEWVNPVQAVYKKIDITVIRNDKNELVTPRGASYPSSPVWVACLY